MKKELRWVRCVYLMSLLTFLCAVNSHEEPPKLPKYRFFKMRTGEGLISYVVPKKTSDSELERLLAFFRERVQKAQFTDIGIDRPTDKRFGKLGYGAGIIAVYRGEKCANEQFVESLGPCGYGEHDDASYQWGVDGDPKHDEGVVRQGNGELRKVF